MNDWVENIVVGTNGPFGSSNCHFTHFTGTVIKVHLSDVPITSISGGGGRVSGSMYGSAFTSGHIDPIRSSTHIKTTYKFWLRSKDGRDYNYTCSNDLGFAEGQIISLISLNSDLIAYVNHNEGVWVYYRDDEEIATLVGQSGYLLANSESIDKANSKESEALRFGVLACYIMFVTSLFVSFYPNIWGWDFIEKPASNWWYLLHGTLAIPILRNTIDRSHAIGGMVFMAIFTFLPWMFGWERWALVFALILTILMLNTPSKLYSSKYNSDAVGEIKSAVHNNANYALNNFR